MYLACPSIHRAIIRHVMKVRMKEVSWDIRETIGGRKAEKGEKKEKVERKAREELELGRKLATTEEESWQNFRAELI